MRNRPVANQQLTTLLGAHSELRNPYHINHEIWRYAKLLLIATLSIAAILTLGIISKRLRSA